MILLRRSFPCECALQSSGTLARDILRMKADDLPRYSCDLEVIGNDLREVEQKSMPYDEVDPDLHDCTGSEEVAKFTPHRIRCQKKAFQEVINIVQARDPLLLTAVPGFLTCCTAVGKDGRRRVCFSH